MEKSGFSFLGHITQPHKLISISVQICCSQLLAPNYLAFMAQPLKNQPGKKSTNSGSHLKNQHHHKSREDEAAACFSTQKVTCTPPPTLAVVVVFGKKN